MLPDRVSNPGPLTYESGALPIALRGPAIVICKGNYFQRKRKGSQSILYRVSQNRFTVRHPIQSEKNGDAKSHMSTGFVLYFKDNNYE